MQRTEHLILSLVRLEHDIKCDQPGCSVATVDKTKVYLIEMVRGCCVIVDQCEAYGEVMRGLAAASFNPLLLQTGKR
jgi:hypothetical protein